MDGMGKPSLIRGVPFCCPDGKLRYLPCMHFSLESEAGSVTTSPSSCDWKMDLLFNFLKDLTIYLYDLI